MTQTQSISVGNAAAFFAPDDADRPLADRFFDLLLIESRLGELNRLAHQGGNWRVWMRIGSELLKLVGPAAEREELRSIDCYRVASTHLLDEFERANAQAGER